MMAVCANPAALGGGSGELHAYLMNGHGIVSSSEATPGPWVNPPQPITTAFVSVPGLLSAECVSNDSGSYLAITVHGDSGGGRTNVITGDVVVNGQILHEWGYI